MLVRWHTFRSGPHRAEAQCFRDEKGANRKAILFCPGFPGMGATLFEQRHAAAFVECGYDVTVIKHKGIRLASGAAPAMVNNAARLFAARRHNETHIGDGPATIGEWLAEPLAAFEELGSYETLDIIGNSFGALSSLWSLTEAAALPKNLRGLLLYAGAQSVWDDTPDSIARLWQPAFIAAPPVTDRVTLNDPVEIAATLKKVYRELPARILARLPENLPLTYLVVAKDELLTLEDTKKFQSAIGGRGKIVLDERDHAWPAWNLLAHDTPNYTTEDLLRLL